MLWEKGPKADFEILVCLYKIDVICKVSPHTIGLFNRTGRNEIHAHALYNGALSLF